MDKIEEQIRKIVQEEMNIWLKSLDKHIVALVAYETGKWLGTQEKAKIEREEKQQGRIIGSDVQE